MLVVSRKRNEKVYAIVPGDLTKDGRPLKIEVMVVEIRADRARLGISAPPEVKLLRDEHQNHVDELMKVTA